MAKNKKKKNKENNKRKKTHNTMLVEKEVNDLGFFTENGVNSIINELSKIKEPEMQEKLRSKFENLTATKEITSSLPVDNIITSNINNKKTIENINAISSEKKDIIGLDFDNILSSYNEAQKNSQELVNNIKKKGFKQTSLGTEVKDIGVFGEVYNILNDSNAPKSIKKEIKNEFNLSELTTPEKLTKAQRRTFIEKTFKGDSNNVDDVKQYMEGFSRMFNNLDEKTLNEVEEMVSKDGNFLKERNQKERKIRKRQAEKEIANKQNKQNKQNRQNIQNNNNNNEAFNIEKASREKKQKKKEEKIKKRKQAEIRNKTGTSGGTLTDFFKGYKGNMLNVGFSVVQGISSYKEGREDGKTILGSAADSVLSFATAELVGFLPMMMMTAGDMAIKGAAKGAKYAVESSRSMNNIQRFSPFADAQFHDTNQLATMRQSGMELAKMSQYNLEQTLMGAEARHLHR